MGMVGRGELAEGGDRIRISAGGVLRPAEMTPEALRVIGIEPHRPANPFDPFFRPSEPGEHLALLHDDEIAVGIEAQRAFLMIGRLVVLVEGEMDSSQDSVHVGVVVVERERGPQFAQDPLLECAPVVAPTVESRPGR